MFHSNADTTPFREHCYYFSRELFTWHSGLAHCESLGGKLVSYDSVEEENFIKRFLGAEMPLDELWIGLARNAHYWARNVNGGKHILFHSYIFVTVTYLSSHIPLNNQYKLVNS